MPAESVRNVTVGDDWEPSTEPSEILKIEFDSPDSEECERGGRSAFPIERRYEDYPLSSAIKYKGTYNYRSSPSFGSSSSSTGKFEIRPDSGLIILETNSDRPKPKEIIDALSETINQSIEIQREFVPGREEVWDFLSRVNDIDDGELGYIEVIPPFGGITRIDFQAGEPRERSGVSLEEASGKYPVEYATMQMKYGEDSFIVEYSDGQLIIESSDDDAKEFVYQVFESAMGDF